MYSSNCLAAMRNMLDIVKCLISAGSKVNYQYGRNNETISHLAIKKGNVKLTNILMR